MFFSPGSKGSYLGMGAVRREVGNTNQGMRVTVEFGDPLKGLDSCTNGIQAKLSSTVLFLGSKNLPCGYEFLL